jgi:peptidoglycan/xylan/chitin deacetylase (PgdA/CDA1 family)
MRQRLNRLLLALLLSAAPAAAGASSAVVLAYHHVANDTPPATSVTPATFEAHMDYLAANDFEVWSLPRLVRTVRAGKPVPERTVALTFDDAYVSVFDEAFPRLRERGWPFTVFVTTDYVDDADAGVASWEQLRRMEAAGATIANHSLDHPHMVARSGGGDRAAWLKRMRAQVTEAQRRLEAEMQDPARLFAWPFGEFSPALCKMLAQADFVGFGQQSGAVGSNSDFTALPRFPLASGFASLDKFGLKVRTRPLPVADSRPASGVLPADARRPPLELTLGEGAYRPEGVACYVGGVEAEIERAGDPPRRLTIRPPEPLAIGRTKINCTAPATDSDRWFWYSHLWMKPKVDGSWYAD